MENKHTTSNIVNIATNAKEGQLPNNAQVNAELDAAKDFLQQNLVTAQTTKQEQTLQHAQQVVDITKEAFNQKNPNDNLQLIIRDLQSLTFTTPDMSEDLKKDMKAFSDSFFQFVTSILKSADFRSRLLELLDLLKQIFDSQKPKLQSDIEQGFQDPQKPISESVKDSATQVKSSIQEMNWEDVPQEQRQKMKDGFKSFLRELSQNKELSNSFRHLINIISYLNDQFYKRFDDAAQQLQNVGEHAKQLVQNFAQSDALDRFIQHLKAIATLIKEDPQIQNFLKSIREHIERAIDNPEIISSEEYINKSESLLKEGRSLANKYQDKQLFSPTIEDARNLLDDLKNDQMIQLLSDRISRLSKHFTITDAKGQTKIDWDVVSQIRSLIVPFLIQRIKEVPVPNIQVDDKDYEYLIIQDLFVTIASIIPDHIKIHTHNNLDFNVNDLKADNVNTKLNVKIEGIKPEFKDFYFSFKRKGLVDLKDEGRADLFVTGSGMSINMTFELQSDSDKKILLTSKNVTVHVDDMKVDIKDAKHKVLLNMLTSMFSGTMERQLEKALEQRLEQLGNELANSINQQVLAKIPISDIQNKVQESIVAL